MVKKGHMLCVKDSPGRENSMYKGSKTETEGCLWLLVDTEVETRLRQWGRVQVMQWSLRVFLPAEESY